MRPYAAYSREDGRAGGSVLVIASTVKEARVLAWRSGECLNVDEWIDLAVAWIRDKSLLALADQEKLTAGQAHVVASPPCCEVCGYWGEGITPDGACCYCGGAAGDVLVEALRGGVQQ